MYGPNLKVVIGRRDELSGEPVERVELQLNDGTKNVLLVLKVDPVKCSPETTSTASEWLGEQCARLSGSSVTYHGVVIYDTPDIKFEVIEVDDEVTKP